MAKATRIAIIGAGVIGRRHVAWLRQQPGCAIIGVADPSEAAQAFCVAERLHWTAEYRDLLDEADGVVIAVPNALHVPIGLECVARGRPTLMEKPVADTLEAALDFAAAVERTGTAVLVGHYRRHNPVLHEARRIIQAGMLGRIVAVNMRLAFLKPDAYFAPAWRRSIGAGPVLINFIHDIDALRFLCGEVRDVQAVYAHTARAFLVEDTAAIILTLGNGALATALISDATPSPYGWDLNAAEEPSFPVFGKDPYLIGGTEASLSLPGLNVWSYGVARGWTEPLCEQILGTEHADPYLRQAAHFLAVVRGEAEPAVTVTDGVRNQIVVAAIAEAARTGTRQAVQSFAVQGALSR